MIEKLQQYYGAHIVIDERPVDYKRYGWYSDNGTKTIGIAKQILTKKDEELLSLFLTPISEDEFHISSDERAWQQFLFHGAETLPAAAQEHSKVRFLHFSLKEPFFEKKALEEALQGLLPAPFIIAWQSNQSGVIVELYAAEYDIDMDYDLFQALTTDFFVTPNVLVGKLHTPSPALCETFQWEQRCFETAKRHVKGRHVYTLEDTLPYLFLQQQTASLLPLMLGDVQSDKELLSTVQTYLECNMNVSLAAKKQYMHRNSVQYRVDKFIEKTGIDIKTFKGAVAVYMALLLQQSAQ